MQKDNEIELKLTAPDQAHLDRAYDLFLSAAMEAFRPVTMLTTLHYYDTVDLSLFQAGVKLRTLDACQGLFPAATYVKVDEKSSMAGSISQADEYEFFTPDATLDLEQVYQHPEASAYLKPAADKAVFEYFKTVNARKAVSGLFIVNQRPIVLQLCADNVEFVDATTGDVFKQMYELEIECKTHNTDPAAPKADRLAIIGEVGGILRDNLSGLGLAKTNKAAIGFAHYQSAEKIIPRGVKLYKISL